MVLLVVILDCSWSGAGFGLYAGILPIILFKSVGLKVFLVWWLLAAPGMVLFICWFRVLRSLAFLGTRCILPGLGLVFLCSIIWLVPINILDPLSGMLGGLRLALTFVGDRGFGEARCWTLLVLFCSYMPHM